MERLISRNTRVSVDTNTRLGPRSNDGVGVNARRHEISTGASSPDNEDNSFGSRIRVMATKVKDLGKQLARLVVRLWSRVLRGVLFLIDHILPPHYNSNSNKVVPTNITNSELHNVNDSSNSDETFAPSTTSSPRPNVFPPASSIGNNNTNTNYDAWRRWLYHMIASFIYPYLRRFTTNLLERLATM